MKGSGDTITQSSSHQVAALPSSRDMIHQQLVCGLTLVAVHCVHSAYNKVETDYNVHTIKKLSLQEQQRLWLSGRGSLCPNEPESCQVCGDQTAGRSLREMSEGYCQCLQLYGGGEYRESPSKYLIFHCNLQLFHFSKKDCGRRKRLTDSP